MPESSAPAPSEPIRQQSNVIERVQALTMWSCGRSYDDIAGVTGIKKESLKSLCRRATARGWVRGRRLQESFVVNLPKSGRPPIVTEATAQIIEAVAASTTTSVTHEAVAERIRLENPALKVPSQHTIRRWRLKNKASAAAARRKRSAGDPGVPGDMADASFVESSMADHDGLGDDGLVADSTAQELERLGSTPQAEMSELGQDQRVFEQIMD